MVNGLYTQKRLYFENQEFQELKFEDDRRILPTCVISVLKAKRLLHKGCETYLAHVVDKSTPEVTLDSVSVVQKSFDVFPKNLPSLL